MKNRKKETLEIYIATAEAYLFKILSFLKVITELSGR